MAGEAIDVGTRTGIHGVGRREALKYGQCLSIEDLGMSRIARQHERGRNLLILDPN